MFILCKLKSKKPQNHRLMGDKMLISFSKLDENDHSRCKKARGIQIFKPLVKIPLRSKVMFIPCKLKSKKP